jgi:hypothetical protein
MEEMSAESMTNRSFGRFLSAGCNKTRNNGRGKHILHNYAWHKKGKSVSDSVYFKEERAI